VQEVSFVRINIVAIKAVLFDWLILAWQTVLKHDLDPFLMMFVSAFKIKK
jgi:hypothetical protein